MRRIRRLFPALFVVLILTLAAGFFLFSPEDLERLGKTSLFAILSSSNFVFWLEAGYFDASAELKPLLHTWSLSVEEQFYLVWPLALFFLSKSGSQRIILIVVLLAAGISLLLTEWTLDHDPHAAFYLLPFRVAELGIGALCVWFLSRRPTGVLISESAVLVGLGMIIYSATTYTINTRFPGLSVLLPCCGTALIILYGDNAPKLGYLLRNRLSVGIGLISYSLYLVHWPLFVYYQYWAVEELDYVAKLTLVLCAILAATALYFLVERRFRFVKSTSVQSGSRGFFLRICALVLLFVIPASVTWSQNGWPGRVPEEIRSLVDNVKIKKRARFTTFSTLCRSSNQRCKVFDSEKQNVVILGDSHGMDGFNAVSLAAPEVNLLFAARGACPPFLDVVYFVETHPNTEKCLAHNQRIFYEWEELSQADVIVFSALFDEDSIPRLDSTIDWLNQRTNAKIIVLGTAMTFKKPIPNLIASSGRLSGVNNYVMSYADKSKFAVDEQFKKHYQDSAVKYISKLDLFCPNGVCDMIVSDEYDLLTYDRHHLSEHAATQLAAVLKAEGLFDQ